MDFGPADAIAAAERLIRPMREVPSALVAPHPSSLASQAPSNNQTFDPTTPSAGRARVLALALVVVFVAPFLAASIRLIVP